MPLSLAPKSRRSALALLLGVPLLLLVPLVIAKWRADHPPPSLMDRLWQTDFSHASEVRFDARGDQWQRDLDRRQMGDPRIFIVRNPDVLQDLAAVMHSHPPASQEARTAQNANTTLDVIISVYGGPGAESWHHFSYWQKGKNGYLSATQDDDYRLTSGNLPPQAYTVPPHFAARFEQLLIQIVQRIQGSHDSSMTLD